ncbi:hypothetical protein SNOG_15014 [Parastagonospora nodorum SN15]|uniref:Uncharacterized protein n=1 Tax=Phaeosphaeria nodorum (strain SN15 / ATCC MYA-4574 / FGSC 10173) TaxID=321614 RepID=Q0TZK2_PHANO|nr:hypothetical protein SNOG_15014 [Parastagonospora nodorum SN15]EAT77557.1 hypothetical protein SNOG_15014 [Parastagonospora nodorum SN15]
MNGGVDELEEEYRPTWDPQACPTCHNLRPSIRSFDPDQVVKNFCWDELLRTVEADAPRFSPLIGVARDVSPDASKDDCMALAKAWLDNCINNHKICPSSSQQMPTRMNAAHMSPLVTAGGIRAYSAPKPPLSIKERKILKKSGTEKQQRWP